LAEQDITYPVIFFATKTEGPINTDGHQSDNTCWGCGSKDRTFTGAPTLCISGEEVTVEYCAMCATMMLEQMLRLYIRAFHGKEPFWPIRAIKKLPEDVDPLEEPPAEGEICG